MTKAAAPIDLLRELRAGFEAEAIAFRGVQEADVSAGMRIKAQVAGAKAFAAEQAVKKIDATLRDWA